MDPTDSLPEPYPVLPPESVPQPLPPIIVPPPTPAPDGDGTTLAGLAADLAGGVVEVGVEAVLEGGMAFVGEAAGSVMGEVLGGCASAGCSCLVLVIVFLTGISGLVLACIG